MNAICKPERKNPTPKQNHETSLNIDNRVRLTVVSKDGLVKERRTAKRNHGVDALYRGLASWFLMRRVNNDIGNNTVSAWSNNWYMRVGSDQSTPTAHDMSSLVSEEATNSDSESGQDRQNPTDGVFQSLYTGTFDWGTLPALTIGELGIYMKPTWTLSYRWTFHYYDSFSTRLCFRLSVADGDFEALPIQSTDKLIVEWLLKVSFS